MGKEMDKSPLSNLNLFQFQSNHICKLSYSPAHHPLCHLQFTIPELLFSLSHTNSSLILFTHRRTGKELRTIVHCYCSSSPLLISKPNMRMRMCRICKIIMSTVTVSTPTGIKITKTHKTEHQSSISRFR